MNRCFLAAVATLIASRVEADAGWTESEVVSRALARAPLAASLAGRVKIEEGRGRVASSHANPALSYAREQTFGSLGDAEDIVAISQTLELGNRRGLHGDAGLARAAAARTEGEAIRSSVAADARARFYEVLYRQERARALEGWIAHIEDALAVVMRRERGGDAAVYDVRRLERERAVASGRVAMERAELEAARARLRAIVGAGASSIAVTGVLLPASDPAELATLRASSGSRADLRALDRRLEATAHERRAASRGWVPDLTLEAGWKGVDHDAQGRTDGFVFGASLTLPIWDRASGAARIAEGEAQVLRGERAILQAELEAQLEGAREAAVGLRAAAIEFRQRTQASSGELVRIAAAGYAGGELGLLEWLDAYRGAADDALGSLDLEQAARRARLELDRLAGASAR